ncbi:MAG: YciI family protein [Bryobacteraceae bacterium]|nr:YciI family protein [Bryobacteraceae bacterium]
MRVLVIVKATAASEAGEMPGRDLLEAMGRFNEELAKAGVLLMGEGVHPSSKGVRMRFGGADRTVEKGPFGHTEELLAGFWLWQVKSMDEAIEWAKRCPDPHNDGGLLEIRPLFEMEDFGDALTDERREQEARLRSTR